MDEVEFRRLYNEAVSAADKITAPETKKAMMYVLQLFNALRESIEELPFEDED